MTDFEVITDDFFIQRSVFGEKYEIIVNFSDESFSYKGVVIPGRDFLFRNKNKA